MSGPPTASETFYRDLKSFSDFSGVFEFEHYRPLPADWVLMVTDIVGSSQAIAEGRYKDVNMAGAASITAVLNVCGEIKVPFVFGGDGASIAVPGQVSAAASRELAKLRQSIESSFGLDLRAAAVPLADLRARGTDVAVRKLELSPGNFLAMFAGGGVELADSLIKMGTDADRYVIAAAAEGEPDLLGLSCRWDPLVPRNGRMMALMVRSTSSTAAAMRRDLEQVMTQIAAILGQDPKEAAPVSHQSLRFRWPPRGLWAEARLGGPKATVLARYCKLLGISFLQWTGQLLNQKVGPYDPVAYRSQLFSNTDFRKYDDTLRMVLDVSEAQAKAIETFLEAEFHAGRLIYGHHLDDSALMTCLVFSLENNDHIHFVDSAHGGFSLASSAFKARSADPVILSS
ncbi:hypothetical protein FHS85_001222 [Rhodoligotrophos appendicifer]|uniref:DUF3095 domain-containing protein n=1 Tax=Rhodoligotrophos appendicifer TaxID=987056 RepID=UPI00147830F1|nr:DUF3095 domain-containing protein [Rhodoligotrophos appendicifer]